MTKTIKIFLTVFIISVVVAIAIGAYKAQIGNFLINASFITSAIAVILIVAAMILAGWTIKKVWMPLIAILIIAQGCNYAKSNQQVVISTDCGMTWKKINAGDAVPKGVGNPCHMKVVMPNYPMQGESNFIANLKDRVRAKVHIDYDYSIVEALSFIKEAKFLGKANTNADSGDALDGGAFESAENMVIDKRIKEVSKDLFLDEDIVELDQSELENKLLIKSNEMLEPLGVKLNFITLTFDLDEQTRQAIDVSTAMKIYQSKKLDTVGKKIMEARAGATKITIEEKQNNQPNN